jgi:hypothetical protein
VEEEVHGAGKGLELYLISLIVIKIGKIGEFEGRSRIQSQAFLQIPRKGNIALVYHLLWEAAIPYQNIVVYAECPPLLLLDIHR